MGATRAQRLIKSMKPKVDTKANIASNMELPNVSGDHTRSIKRAAPVIDQDLANKKYVDDQISALSSTYLKLDASNDPVTDSLVLNKGLVVNESGGDNDFRVESQSDANALWVDASTNRVGINCSSLGWDDKLRIQQDNDSDNTGIKLLESTGTYAFKGYVNNLGEGVFNGDNGLRFNAGGPIAFNAGGTATIKLVDNDFFYIKDEDGNAIVRVDSDATTNCFWINAAAAIFNGGSDNFDFRVNGDTVSSLLNTDAGTDNVAIGGAGSFGSGKGVLFITDAATNPSSNPTGGGILYVDSGALKYRGSSGTVTTIAPA